MLFFIFRLYNFSYYFSCYITIRYIKNLYFICSHIMRIYCTSLYALYARCNILHRVPLAFNIVDKADLSNKKDPKALSLGASRLFSSQRETKNAPRWSATSCSPTGLPRSTIGARGLNFRVRNGTGCASPAMVADQRGTFSCQGRALGAAQRDFLRRLHRDSCCDETCRSKSSAD